nr:hypothetical protein [Tanacetum cinerariifolium]
MKERECSAYIGSKPLVPKFYAWSRDQGAKVVTKEGYRSASLTQRMGSNIPTVISWGSSIGPEGFMPSILLLVVIIVMVLVIVVVIGGVPSIIKLSFVITESSSISLDTISFYNQVVKFILHSPDFSLRIILIGQESFQFSPCDLVGLLYSNRFSIGIPQGQGIFGESTSRKFHFAVLGTVATRKSDSVRLNQRMRPTAPSVLLK